MPIDATSDAPDDAGDTPLDDAAHRDVDIDTDAGARGVLYGILAQAFETPDETFHGALADGSLSRHVDAVLERTTLDVEVDSDALTTDDDFETLSARYNDIFAIGYSEYIDPTDGTLSLSEPAVPLYESAYRTGVSWNDVNLDLARAYAYFGVGINESYRDHHDHLRLQLEFAGYLARREATVDESAARARLDFLDRHLRILVEGVVERLRDEPGTGAYAVLADVLDAFTAADRDDLAERTEGGGST